ncbi:complement decay-accelerating factor-like [Phascolarctos cinereus]
MLIESPRRQSAEESSRWGRSCLAVRGGSRVHLEPRASAMGACPRRGAWLCSVGLLGALALLPRALLALPLNLDGCFPPGPYPGMKRSAEFISRLRFPFNITVTFVCQPGYTLSKPGPLLSTCQDDGTWSPVSGSCNKPPCSYPVNFENGHAYVPTDTSVGSIIMYYCDEGYTLIGDV